MKVTDNNLLSNVTEGEHVGFCNCKLVPGDIILKIEILRKDALFQKFKIRRDIKKHCQIAIIWWL